MRLPAGIYYLGDPCYAFDHNDVDDPWMEFLGVYWAAEEAGQCVFTFRGFECFAHGTAYGDGFYGLEGGGSIGGLSVDAGIIGCLPKALVEQLDAGEKGPVSSLALHEFSQDFEVGYDDGEFRIGGLSVRTGGSIDEEEEDELGR